MKNLESNQTLHLTPRSAAVLSDQFLGGASELGRYGYQMADSLKMGSEVTIYYQFLSSRDAMTDLERKMIKVSRIVNLNDLFELRPYLLIKRDKRSRLEKLRSQIAKTHGMICFSSDWQEPLLSGTK